MSNPTSDTPVLVTEDRRRAAARLEAARAELGRVSDGEIARRLGVARKTVVEFRKKHGIPAYAPTPAAPDVEAQGPAVGRASKLDSHLDIVGTLPDREVAERVGMTTENVRMYRQRRQIPAGWRSTAAPAAALRGRHPSAPGETRVEKALAAHREVVGALPDAEVAARAGVSRSAVSAYRARHQIQAARTRAEPTALSAWAVSARRLGERTGDRQGEEHTFGLLAPDPMEAMRRACALLGGRDAGWSVVGLRLVGEALVE